MKPSHCANYDKENGFRNLLFFVDGGYSGTNINRPIWGERLCTNPPYGYMKEPDNKKRWIVDEATVEAVKRT